MGKSSVILVLTLFISVVFAAAAFGAKKMRETALRDGFVLAGVDGKLIARDSNDIWFFEFDSDVGDDGDPVKAGTSLELLPSAALEKMIADAKERSSANYRLWGRVTKYKDKNFIFPVYFLPLSKLEQPQPQQSQQQEAKSTINEPNDVLTIPDEIVKKLKTRPIQTQRRARTEQPGKGLKLKQDCILVDRTGFISSLVCRDAYCAKRTTQYDIRNTQYGLFVLDAIGRGLQQNSIRLLGCQALELAQQAQSAEPDPIRFKISGIVTQYKGKHYLLLQRAARVYSHENFGR